MIQPGTIHSGSFGLGYLLGALCAVALAGGYYLAKQEQQGFCAEGETMKVTVSLEGKVVECVKTGEHHD